MNPLGSSEVIMRNGSGGAEGPGKDGVAPLRVLMACGEVRKPKC